MAGAEELRSMPCYRTTNKGMLNMPRTVILSDEMIAEIALLKGEVNGDSRLQRLLEQLSTAIQQAQTYTAKLKTRKQMEADIPRDRLGWWHDVCAGKTLRNLRAATKEDLQRCCMKEGSSRNPDDYLCENIPSGSLVSREAIAQLSVDC